MANHIIQQVRDDLLSRITGLTTTGANAFLFNQIPQDETKVPFLYLRTLDDQDQRVSLGYPCVEEMLLNFEISIVVYANGDYESAALNIRKEIELALFGSIAAVTLGGKIVLLTRPSAQIDEDETGGKPTYVIRLQITAQVRHLESQPDSFIY